MPSVAETGDVGGVDELRMLHAVHGTGHRRQALDDVEHGPHGGIADGVDLAGDAGLGCAAGQLGQLLVACARACPWGRPAVGRPAIVGLVGCEQGRGAAAQRAVAEELQPAIAVATTLVALDRAAGAEADLDGSLQLVLANTGHHAQRQVASRGPSRGSGRDRLESSGSGATRAGIVHGGHTQRGQRAGVGAHGPVHVAARSAPR